MLSANKILNYIVRMIPDRARYLPSIVAEIPNVIIIMDRHRKPMETFLNALSIAGEKPTVHLEDDVILCKDFRVRAERIIEQYPDSVIQFFSMRSDDIKIGQRWDNSFCSSMCFYLPYNYSTLIRRYYPRWERREEHPTAYDYLVNDFLRDRKERYLIVVPNLADHRQIKSAINPKRSSKRISRTFIYEGSANED